jgi:hypothetical protein
MPPPGAPDAGPGTPGGPVTAEHLDFLARNSRVFLIVRGRGGAPTGYPMTGRMIDGTLQFNTYRKSAKMAHIRRDGRVCCVVVPSDPALDRRTLTVWGYAALDEAGPGRWIALAESGGDGRMPVPDAIVAGVRENLRSGKRVIVRVDLVGAVFGTGDGDFDGR